MLQLKLSLLISPLLLTVSVRAGPMSGTEASSSLGGQEHNNVQTREEVMHAQLAQHFPDVVYLDDMSNGDSKRVLEYYKTRGRWFHGDKYAFDDYWPEPFASERREVLRQERKARGRKRQLKQIVVPGLPAPLVDLSSLSRALPCSYESAEDEPQLYFDEPHTSQINESVTGRWFNDANSNWQDEYDRIYDIPIIYGRCFEWLRKEHQIKDFTFSNMLLDFWGNREVAAGLFIRDEHAQQEAAEQLWQHYLSFRRQNSLSVIPDQDDT